MPITIRPSRRGRSTGGGVVVSKRRGPSPVRSIGGLRAGADGSLYADHTSVSSSSCSGRRADSVSCFINRGISPVAGSVQCGSCSVSLLPNESAGPLSSSLPKRTTPNSSPKSIVGSLVLSLPRLSLPRLSLDTADLLTLREVLVPYEKMLFRLAQHAPALTCRVLFRRAPAHL